MKNQTQEIKRPSVAGLEKAFTIVAFSSLNENGEPVDTANVEAESARIERCVEYFYKQDTTFELDYPQFASKFLQEKFYDLVHTTKYLGDFLDDVSNDVQEKQYYMDDAKFIS
jgi:hypothetical protein